MLICYKGTKTCFVKVLVYSLYDQNIIITNVRKALHPYCLLNFQEFNCDFLSEWINFIFLLFYLIIALISTFYKSDVFL